jgi:4-aminobutyrate aminotransferase
MQHFGVSADIIAVAKGIASGLPLGAMIAPAKIMNWEAGSHASTFGGNPLSCQAAMATIEMLENNLMENADRQGKRLVSGLLELQKTNECMGDIRGKGLMVAVELVKNRETKEPAVAWRNRIIKKAFGKGLLLLGCGENSIRFSPSLTVAANEIDVCLSIFEEAVREVANYRS